jgi:hypothetical protein
LRRYVRERGWELFKEFCDSRFLSRWGVDLIPLGATSYSMHSQPPRRFQGNVFGEATSRRSSRESQPRGRQGGVSGWLCEGKKAQPRLKNRRRLSEGLGEVVGGGMAASRS